MIKTFLNKVRGSKEEPEENYPLRVDETDWLKELIEFFSIGRKLLYYPEFKKNVLLDTFILAYCVNGRYLYSVDAIQRDDQGSPAFFCTGEDGEGIAIADVELFQFVVPDTSDLELQLDYESRALIGRGRQFVKGNDISLVSSMSGRGSATVDTQVATRLFLKDGPYEQTKLVLLTPELRSLVVTDQRKNPRAKVSVPIMLSVQGGRLPVPCTIVDISNGALCIRLQDTQMSMPEMAKGSTVVFAINFAGAEQGFSIKGTVIRNLPDVRVIQLDGIFKDGRTVPFSTMDHLALKAGLLNYRS